MVRSAPRPLGRSLAQSRYWPGPRTPRPFSVSAVGQLVGSAAQRDHQPARARHAHPTSRAAAPGRDGASELLAEPRVRSQPPSTRSRRQAARQPRPRPPHAERVTPIWDGASSWTNAIPLGCGSASTRARGSSPPQSSAAAPGRDPKQSWAAAQTGARYWAGAIVRPSRGGRPLTRRRTRARSAGCVIQTSPTRSSDVPRTKKKSDRGRMDLPRFAGARSVFKSGCGHRSRPFAPVGSVSLPARRPVACCHAWPLAYAVVPAARLDCCRGPSAFPYAARQDERDATVEWVIAIAIARRHARGRRRRNRYSDRRRRASRTRACRPEQRPAPVLGLDTLTVSRLRSGHRRLNAAKLFSGWSLMVAKSPPT